MIDNACNKKLKDLSSAVPNVGAAVMELLMPCRAVYVLKQQISGYTQEVLIDVITKVSIQPNPQLLKMLPEGQRKWKTYTIFALSNLDLEPDEVFTINYMKYRILAKTNWKEYGFIEYSTVEDYHMDAPDPTLGTGYNT